MQHQLPDKLCGRPLVARFVRTSHDGQVDVRRTLRLAWIALANGTAIYVQYADARQRALLNHLLEQDSQNRTLWFHFALWAAIPALGIALEVFHSRYAKWINLGYFAYFGVVFSAMGVLSLPDQHAVIALFYGVVALSFFVVSYFLYRKPKPIPTA
jgi:hypothetical protein